MADRISGDMFSGKGTNTSINAKTRKSAFDEFDACEKSCRNEMADNRRKDKVGLSEYFGKIHQMYHP